MFVMGYYNRNSREPIAFWAGDKMLKEKVKNVKGYNSEISRLYIRCSLVFLITGIICLIHFGIGVIFILAESSLGIYIAWKIYKNILSRYS